MTPFLLAVVAGFAFALQNFFARLGLEESVPVTAVAVNVTTNALSLWVLSALFPPFGPLSR